MDKRQIKILGEIRAHLVYQRYNGLIKFKMDQAIDKIDQLMCDDFDPDMPLNDTMGQGEREGLKYG
jgi:hypothetical protein